ncbi:hypothetical protein P154DRAFT_527267 [Amniculicola lignicola CBS 123094]|uniref:Uncharacterized protein n=1 Tax=Amniculicola lignicola CBS 123094 TaxID=1392246 RepID=A0A6A5VX30_9PLEO|nr:hypothetical protein P154DRAFT_527267 [Amniculicola lignicola CBS 123094]
MWESQLPPRGNEVWHLLAVTSRKIQRESMPADTNLYRMVLLCNTLDTNILQFQDFTPPKDDCNIQLVKGTCDGYLQPDKHGDCHESTDSDDSDDWDDDDLDHSDEVNHSDDSDYSDNEDHHNYDNVQNCKDSAPGELPKRTVPPTRVSMKGRCPSM